MVFKKLAKYSGAVVLGLMLSSSITAQAQNKTAAPSITVYQDPT